MHKKNIRYSVIIVLFILLIVLQHFAPRTVSWNYDFRKVNKAPYSCYVLRTMFDTVFSGNKIIEGYNSFYEANEALENCNNIIIITDDFSPDNLDLNILLNRVGEGKSAFISSYSFSSSFSDTLGFEVSSFLFDTSLFRRKKDVLNFTNPEIRNEKGYLFTKKLPEQYFSSFDTVRTLICGTDGSGRANFLRVEYGSGEFFIHTQPVAFTNYHLLYSNYRYASAALSYLPESVTYWDEYYKPGKILNESPVQFLLNHKPLRYSYYCILLTIIIFIIFEAKRKQRVIPVIEPVQNDSLNFVETVGRLYLSKGDHRIMSLKIFKHFNETIREKYKITRDISDGDFYNKLSFKSGISINKIKEIYSTADSIEGSKNIDSERLISFYKKVEHFKKNSL